MKNKNLFLIFGIVFFIGLILSILSLSIYFISASSFGELKVTEEHPFLINGSWIPASDLKVGDELTTISGKKVRITSIEDIETKEPFPVYNLEAGKYHDFVVDGGDGLGVIVHNSNLKEKWGLFQNQLSAYMGKYLIGEYKIYGRLIIGKTPTSNLRELHFMYGELGTLEDISRTASFLRNEVASNPQLKYVGLSATEESYRAVNILKNRY
jgi:hypothetical protein